MKQANMKQLGLIVVAIVSLAACSSTPPAAPGAAAQTSTASDAKPDSKPDSKGVICSNEKTIGSNRVTKRCTTAEQRAAEQRRAERELKRDPATGGSSSISDK
jgi:hypothetical protein